MKNIIKIITVLTTVVISSFAHSEYKVRSDVFMFKLPGADAWISGAEYNLYGSWVDVSSPVCGVWSPQITDQDASFIQSRSCDTDQERSVTIREYNTEFDIYRTTNTFNEERVYSTNEQRTVVVTASSWLDQGAVYSCSEWSPAINGQTSDFTQTRDCQQDQTRDLTYEINGSVVESKTISQTVIKTQSRVVDVASSSGGGNDGWSAWTTYSQDNNCTTWSPATSTVNQGQSFTQTRTCYDYQERFKYYVIDGQVVDTDRETRTVTDNKSRTNTGTKVLLSVSIDQPHHFRM